MSLDLTPRLRRPVALSSRAQKTSLQPAGDHRQSWLAWILVVLTAAITAAFVLYPEHVSATPILPIVVAAGLFLQAGRMYLVYAAAACGLLLTSINAPAPPLTIAAIAVVMLLMLAVERRRKRIGIAPDVGASMLVELRERLGEQGRLSDELPEGWHLDSSVQAAHGEAFSGDFLVANRSAEELLEIVLVDVAGKGLHTGTRSLMLSGAFSGLLGSTAPADFLPAANRYLVRQDWADGYATAVHVALDLTTGDYCVGTAGHPAAMQFHGGAGRWEAMEGARGVMLGVLDSSMATFERQYGRLERGDALLLFSDGVIESPSCDLGQGIDRMLGEADRVVADGVDGGAERICAVAMAGESDDRSAVLLRRD